jgi:hypothetical protein
MPSYDRGFKIIAHVAGRRLADRRPTACRSAEVLGIFGRLAYPELGAFALIGREQMKESPAYQEIMDEGRVEQGRADILASLKVRFGQEAAEQVRTDVQAVEDLNGLIRLHDLSVGCLDLDALREGLRREMPPRRNTGRSSRRRR